MLPVFGARFMVRVPSLVLFAALPLIPSVILWSSDNPDVHIGPRPETPPCSNSPLTGTSAKGGHPLQLNLNPYPGNNPPNVVEPKRRAIDIDDLSEKDQILWLKVVGLANTQDEDGNYVNSVLHGTYAALASGFRVFKIENNPNLGPGTVGQFTITKFNGPNDFSEAQIDLNFRTIKQINSTTAGDYDPSFQKYSGLVARDDFILRLAETFGHEASHGIFGQRHPAQGTAIQKMLNDRDAAMRALPLKRRYPLSPDILQKLRAADQALEPTERFAQAEERIINAELQTSKVRASHRPRIRPNLAQAAKSGTFLDSPSKTPPSSRSCE
jgi:hypothetical protein